MDADSAKLDFDTSDTVKGVQRAVDAFDELVQSMLRLDRASAAMAAGSAKKFATMKAAADSLGKTNFKTFVTSLESAYQALAEGEGNPGGVKLVARQNAALQALYEARLASVVRMTNAELAVWKDYGANLGKLQQAQLRGRSLDGLAGLAEGLTGNAAVQLQAGAANTGAVATAAAAAAKREADAVAVARSAAFKEALTREAENFARSPETLAAMAKFYTLQDSIASNQTASLLRQAQLGYEQRSKVHQEELAKAAQAFASSPETLRSMAMYYGLRESIDANQAATARKQAQLGYEQRSKLHQEELAKAAQAFASSPETLRSMAMYYGLRESIDANQAATARKQAQLGYEQRNRIHQEELAKAAAAFARSPSTLANMAKYYTLREAIDANTAATIRKQAQEAFAIRSQAYKEEQQRLTGDNSGAMALLRQQYSTPGGSAFMESLRATTPEFTRLSSEAMKAGNSLGFFQKHSNDVHSGLRGLASGFNLLWLTWGNLGPLFVGAALSNGFMQTAKTGLELSHTLAIIGTVGDNTTAQVEALRNSLLELAKTGPFGPLEIAEAMKTLSLAGLRANEILAVTPTVLQFSVAGTTDVKTAADSLVSISTAFGLGAEGFGRVSDVISKASADSMVSVESFSESMKAASVIAGQYGASVEDVAVQVMALGNIGIRGSAAGTAIKNAYGNLAGNTKVAAETLKQLGVEALDANGKFKPILQIVGDLDQALRKMSAKDEQATINKIANERASKSIVELLRQVRTEAKDTGMGVASAMSAARASMDEAAGFSAITAARLAQTSKNQFAQVGSTIKSTMAQAFATMEPLLLIVADRLQKAFGSPEAVAGLEFLVGGIAKLGAVLAENLKFVVSATAAYAGWRLLLAASLPFLDMLATKTAVGTAATVVDTVATNANTAAKVANRVATLGSATAVGTLARAIPFVGTAITAASAAWLAYEYFAKNSNETATEAVFLSTDKIIDSLRKQAKELQDINALRLQGLSYAEATARLEAKATSSGLEAVEERARADNRKLQEQKEKLLARPGRSGSDKLGDALVLKNIDGQIAKNTSLIREAAAKREAARAAAQDVVQGRRQQDAIQANEIAARLQAQQGLRTPTTGAPVDGAGGSGSPKSIGNELQKHVGDLQEQNAALAEKYRLLGLGVSLDDEALRIESAKAKALADVGNRYREATTADKEFDAAAMASLATDKAKAEALVRENSNLEYNIYLRNKEIEALKARTEAMLKYNEAELDSARKRRGELAAQEADLSVSRNTLGKSSFDLALEAKLRGVNSKYDERKRETANRFKETVADLDTIPAGQQAKYENDLAMLDRDRAAELGLTTSQAYAEAWNSSITNLSSNFVDQMLAGTLDIKEFMIQSFADMVLKPQLNLTVQKGMDWLFKGALSFLGLPSFDGGGYTGSGPRSGGLDGKGGRLAMVHPDETVIDHTKGQSYGSAPVYVTINQTVGDIATKSMLVEAQQATVRQVQVGIARSQRYRGALSNG